MEGSIGEAAAQIDLESCPFLREALESTYRVKCSVD